MTELAQPKNFLDRVAVWCATYLIFVIIGLAILLPEFISPLMIGFPILLAWFVAFILQKLFHRRRPFQNGERPLIKMLFETPSFPSAHTAIATSVLPIMVFGEGRTAVTTVFVLLAAVMAWSRVRVRVHYVSDTIAGALIGAMTGYAAIFLFASFITWSLGGSIIDN